MLSSRAQEYITRFTTKGVQKKTVLKKIVEYREDCKGLYNEAETKNPMNYRAAEDKRVYLKDMRERIRVLAEARDYLQDEIDNINAKSTNMYSAVAFAPTKETKSKPTKETKSKPAKKTNMYYDEDETEWEHFDRMMGRT